MAFDRLPPVPAVSAAVGGTIAVVEGSLSTAAIDAIVVELRREVIEIHVASLAEVLDGRATMPHPVLLVWSPAGFTAPMCERAVEWALLRSPSPGLIGWAASGRAVDAETLLASGFDDAVIGPCSARELAARIRAVHRRVHWSASHRGGRLRHRDLVLDTDAQELWIDGKAIQLTSTELPVMCALMRARGRTVSRVDLLDQGWGTANFEISERAVDNVILRLRRKLGRPDLIETVRGVGFRLASVDDAP